MRSLTAGLLTLVFALPSFAQSPPQNPGGAGFRQDVVVTAAVWPIEIGLVTRTLTVISRDEIGRLPVNSVADVLRLVSAVDVRARGERGVQTDFVVRGANFGQMLVLVDGIRLNDAQSGHHNGDIPVPLDAVERIEILHGPGASLFGADAFGGTINVITRGGDAASASGVVHSGSFGLIGGRGQVSTAAGSVRQLFAGSIERSSGFMVERGFATAGVTSRTAIGDRTRVLASYLWKDFGANGFYGNAPSHEWTNQTLVAADRRFDGWRGWRATAQGSYRTHGDRFVFDVRRPGLAESRHRTHAVIGTLRALHPLGRGLVAAGVEAGGEWIDSSNLGDHDTQRISAFAEWRGPLTQTLVFDTSLRVDRYTEFGTSVSPAIGAAWWPTPRVRWRASSSRGFRVPTFTERYYSDPAHRARSEVGPETSWGGDTGMDLFTSGGWAISGTIFGRLDEDVIDWLRADTNERWRTYNIRHVDTAGVEMSIKRAFAGGSFVQAGYTFLDVNAAAVSQLSKYVLDYAPHGVIAAGSIPLVARIQLAPRLEYRYRTRSTGESQYALLDLRLSRAVGRYDVRVEGTNLANTSYQEVAGVAMPGRAVSIALAIGR